MSPDPADRGGPLVCWCGIRAVGHDSLVVVHAEARPPARDTDDIPAPLWLLPALWLVSAVVLDVAEHHRLAARGAMTVNAVIGAIGAFWVVSGVLHGYRGSRVVARLVYAVGVVAGVTGFLGTLHDHRVVLAAASVFVAVAAFVSWRLLGMSGAWLDARRLTGRRTGCSRALLAASVVAVGVATAITATSSASTQSGSIRAQNQAWHQLSAISTTDADAAAATLLTNVLPAAAGDPLRVTFLAELARRVGADRLGHVADRNRDARDDDGLVSLRLPSGQLAACLQLTSSHDGQSSQAALAPLTRCP